MTSRTGSLDNIRSSAAKKPRSLQEFIKRYHDQILLTLAIILVILVGCLVYLLVTGTFKEFFTCKHLIDDALHITEPNYSLCEGIKIQFGPYHFEPPIIPAFDLGPYPENPFPVTPALKPINGPLEVIRKFVAWNIILAFAVVSLVLAFIVIKIKGFVEFLLTPEGRRVTLTKVSIWLLIFAIFCGLFYFGVVVGL